MDDLNAKLNEILSDPNSMQQIQSMLGSLGQGNDNSGEKGQPPESGEKSPPMDLSSVMKMMGNANSNQGKEGGSMPDLSALSSLMGNSSQGGGSMPDLSVLSSLMGNSSQGGGSMPDLSALSSLMGNSSQGGGSMPDLSALSGLFKGASSQGSGGGTAAESSMQSMISAVTKMAPMLQRVQQEDDSTRLLYALRPFLSAKRQKKLDEATKILRMMRMMPLLKESGLFASLL